MSTVELFPVVVLCHSVERNEHVYDLFISFVLGDYFSMRWIALVNIIIKVWALCMYLQTGLLFYSFKEQIIHLNI